MSEQYIIAFAMTGIILLLVVVMWILSLRKCRKLELKSFMVR